MPESLVKASMIHLFGRVVEDLQINSARGSGASSKRAAKSVSSEQPGAGHALSNQLAAEGSCLARIYAFAYEGGYYELAQSSLLLVHGDGVPIGDPLTVERIGSAAASRTFADDVRVWAYDKSDISLRLDVETGTLEQILLEAEIKGDRLRATFAGAKVRLRNPSGGDQI
jgi:hypothetical protein